MLSQWNKRANRVLHAIYNRSGETPLIKLNLPCNKHIKIYIKDESVQISGSLKHRLAASLFSYGIVNGYIRDDTTIIEASSGCTAVSEAYFAKELGLDFIAVIPSATSEYKKREIQLYDGHFHVVDSSPKMYEKARELAKQCQGYYMNQFRNAQYAVNWRNDNTIIGTIIKQLMDEPFSIPRWFVTGAGTGSTSLCMGRYILYHCLPSEVCVVDPENSVFFEYYKTGNSELNLSCGSRIEGIGRPRVEHSFNPKVIDQMIKVPDVRSLAALHFLQSITNKRFGGSTGTAFYGALQLAHTMHQQAEEGAIVLIAGDGGERYQDTYYHDDWLQQQGFDLQPYIDQYQNFFEQGAWQLEPCEMATKAP